MGGGRGGTQQGAGGPGGPTSSSADGRLRIHLLDEARGELGLRGRRALLVAHAGPELVAGDAGDLDPDEAARRHRHRQLRALRPLRQGLRILRRSSGGVAREATRGAASEHDAHELGLAPAEHLVMVRVRARLRRGGMVRLGALVRPSVRWGGAGW